MSAEKQPLRMDAYYFGFAETGAHSIDRILSAVACAGKAYHLTEDWRSECEPYHPEMRGDSCVDWIQNAAADAATERAELLDAGTAALKAMREMHEAAQAGRQVFLDRGVHDALAAALAQARGDK